MTTLTIQDLQSQLEQALSQAEQALRAPTPRLLERTQSLPITGFFHAVTGQRLLLPPDEALAYLQLGADFFKDLQPMGVRETHAVQRIIDITWRLHRATAMENNIIETETLRHAQPHDDARTGAVAAQAAAIRNDCENTGALDILNRYDARLTRVLRQTNDELERLQASREKKGKPGFVREECHALLWYEEVIGKYAAQKAEPPMLTKEPTDAKQSTYLEGSLRRNSFPATGISQRNTPAKPRQLHHKTANAG